MLGWSNHIGGGETNETVPEIMSAGGGSESASKTECCPSSLPNVPSSHTANNNASSY